LDVTFEGAEHSGLSGVALVQTLLRDFPALQPLFLVVKTLLSEKALDNPYTGGLSSFGLVLLITRFLQHINVSSRETPRAESIGELLAGFLEFVGNGFDPRATGISIGPHVSSSSPSTSDARKFGGRFLRRDQPLTVATALDEGDKDAGRTPFHRSGSTSSSANRTIRSSDDSHRDPPSATPHSTGPVNINSMTAQQRRYRLDPIYIENPLAPQTNVTRNCFRIYRIQRLLSDALVNLRNAVLSVPRENTHPAFAPANATATASAAAAATLQPTTSFPSPSAPSVVTRPPSSRILHSIISSPELF